MMTDQMLQAMVEQISLDVFQKPFRHRAFFNRRLRTTGGRYMLGDHSIQINLKVYERYGEEELRGVIKHELCHYHLHLEGKGYQHRDADFRALLAKTNSPRFCQPLQEKKLTTIYHYYRCEDCEHLFERKKRMNPQKYRCGKCRGRIQYVKASLL